MKKNKAQTILEYLAVLAIVVLGGTAATVFFRAGARSGLGEIESHLQETLPHTIDNTHEAKVIPFDVTYTGESTIDGGAE